MDWIVSNIGVIGSLLAGLVASGGLVWVLVRWGLKKLVSPENGSMIRGWIVDRLEEIPDESTKALLVKKAIRETDALGNELREIDVVKK